MSEITKARPTADRVHKLLEYFPETGKFLWRSDRTLPGRVIAKAGSIAGTKTKRGRWIISVDGRQYYAHHLAWLVMRGEWPAEIDHINTDALDNRWENLRLGNDQLNAENKRQALTTNKSSGVLGVSHQKRSRKNPWKAQIRIEGRIKYLGGFPTIEAAEAAYIEAKRRHHQGCTL